MSEVICCVQNIHIRELIARMHWVVRIRWAFIAACVAGALAAILPQTAFHLQPVYFFGVAIFLTLANLYYRASLRHVDAACVGTLELREHCFRHVLGDYLALAVIVYALGTVETPVMFLVLPNIFLAALFFTRRQGLGIAVMGLVLVTLPVALEAGGVLPVVNIYGSQLKADMLGNTKVLLSYLVLFTACVLTCWYLISEITDSLIENELELEDSYQSMVLLDEEKTRATTRATHELKAPLAAIKSYVYTLEAGYAGELPEQARNVVHRIGVRCDRLLEEVTDIIRLSNLKTYVITGDQLKPLDLMDALSREVDEARHIAAPRRIEVEFDPTLSRPLRVRANDEHLRTLFSNLLTNAVNYSRAGDRVTVRLRQEPEHLTVEIADQGIGIPAELLKRVFEEHFRANNAVAHHESGTGLGLPIVRATARLLDAELNLESAEGVGTTATLRFKRTDQ